ncbi:MAG: hypothetical protein WCF23_14775 [Candidatus Nitrosopolaris sp.]
MAFMLLTSQYSAFNGLPLSIQQAKAIKHKDSAPPQGPDSNDGNTIPSSSSSQSDPDFAADCINYNPSTEQLLSTVVQLDLLISTTNSMITVFWLNNLQQASFVPIFI